MVPLSELVAISSLRPTLLALIRRQVLALDESGYVSLGELNKFRIQYVEEALRREAGELTDLEKGILESFREQENITRNTEAELNQRQSFGDRLADHIANFGGSWNFIVVFFAVLLGWILLNATLLTRPFDPYPFILMNLVLSCLAAIQAPIIMMSQNRMEARDRLRAENDYQVNLKAEIEIRHLHEKMDHLLMHQWQRLMETQQIQLEILQEIVDKTSPAANERD
ncbi:DUF1003 domain-containing protein [Catalinimonas alkaloidigena]|nr:DUF1003 domain-containing protein [Catalinimonas alkaloidigena]